jgi:hypothetical protein
MSFRLSRTSSAALGLNRGDLHDQRIIVRGILVRLNPPRLRFPDAPDHIMHDEDGTRRVVVLGKLPHGLCVFDSHCFISLPW